MMDQGQAAKFLKFIDLYTSLRGVIIATWAIAIVIVCLRFLARRFSKAGLWYDDWLILPAIVSNPRMIITSPTPLVQEDNSSSHIYQLVATALCFLSAISCKFLNCTKHRSMDKKMLILNSTVVNRLSALWRWEDNATEPNNTERLEAEEPDDKTALLGYFTSQICWVFVLWVVKCSILAFYWRLFSGNARSTRVAIWTIAVLVTCWAIIVVSSPLI